MPTHSLPQTAPRTKAELVRIVSAVLFFCLAASSLLGQAVSGRLEGTVQDASKALIASATVTATLQETGQSVQIKTNESGLYLFPHLDPGHYTLSITANGFNVSKVTGLVLQVGDSKRADVVLKPASLSQSVDVVSQGVTVNTDTAEVGAVVSNQQAVQLPLNGRDAAALVYLQAGTNPLDIFGAATVTGAEPSQQQVGVVDGLPPGTSEIKVEGVMSSNSGYDYSPAHPSMPVPQEAVGEYRVSTSGYEPDSGRGSGAQVNLLVKSGTNKFHGSIFEFNRNTIFDANDYFDKQSGKPRPVLQRNQFGGAIGGPILKGKTFFFATAEWQRQISDSVENRLVYTPTMRTGIFRYNKSGVNNSSLVDSNGNLVVPASQIGSFNVTTIDPSRQGFDQVFLPKVLAVEPAPNNYSIGDALNTAGYRYQSSNPDNYYQYLFKVDHQITPRHKIAGTYSQEYEQAPQPRTIAGQSYEGFNERRNGLAIRYDAVIGPTFVNELSLGGSRRIAARPELIAASQGPANNFQLVGLGTVAPSTGSTDGNLYSTGSAQLNPADLFGFSDVATKTYSHHTLEFGGEIWFDTLNRTVGTSQYPIISTVNSAAPANVPNMTGLSAQDKATGQQLVNDFTGTAAQITQTFFINNGAYVPYAQLHEEDRKHEYGVFAQDIWKLRRNLTVDLGLRYDLFPPMTIANGFVYPTNGYQGALGVYGPTGQPTTYQYARNHGGNIYGTDTNNFGPSVGLVYDPFGKGQTSVRASYRISYDRQAITNVDYSQANYGASTSITLTPAVQFSQIGTVLPIATPTPFATSTANVRQGNAEVAIPNLTTPYAQSWTFGIQQEFLKDWSVQANYIGNHVVGEYSFTDLNQVNLVNNGFLAAFQIAQQNYAANGSPVRGQSLGTLQTLFSEIPASLYSNFTIGAAATVANYLDTTAVGGVRGAYITNAGLAPNFFRTNPQVLDLYVETNKGQSNYNALQVEVLHRLRRGFYLQANYTFSKNFDNYQGTAGAYTSYLRDNANPNLNKTLSALDATHVALANGIYELPFGKGQRFGANAGGLMNALIGGWRVTGISSFTTGRPLAITTGYNLFNQNVASTPNYNGNYGHISEIDKSATQVRFISKANAANFSNPSAGQVGGVPVYSVRGPGFVDTDMGISKSLSLSKLHEGMNLEMRFEEFNVFNHANFAQPTGNSLNNNAATFGVLTSTVAPRIGQLAAKINF
jgi:hypothetical protein